MKNINAQSMLDKFIDVNSPIIFIQDYDFVRVDEIISNVLQDMEIEEWCPGTGRTDFYTKESRSKGDREDLIAFLREIVGYKVVDEVQPQPLFVVLKEIQEYINVPEVRNLLQLISLRKLYDRNEFDNDIDGFDTTIILVSSNMEIPTELKHFVSYLEIEFPTEQEISDIIDEHVELNNYSESFKQSDKQKIMPSLKGMSLFEIDRMLDMAMSSNGTLSAEDRELILKHKKQMVKQSGLIELIDTPEDMNSIGGLDNLKKYLNNKSIVMQHLGEAIAYKVAIPKGIFLVGMPGCGKSLCAKAAAAKFEVPLLKLDIGNLMGKYQGESEGNLRKAIRIAEAAAPCVLWIDEIEKAFAGVGDSENASMTRMFGSFLGWMQDKKSAVYVVATANNAEKLPPELKRKGRFDEIFCVDLPNDNERKEIFKVHLAKHGYTTDVSTELIAATQGFNGADIESVVNEAVEKVFVDSINGNNSRLDDALLTKIASNTKSISLTCKSQIDKMHNLFNDSKFTKAS